MNANFMGVETEMSMAQAQKVLDASKAAATAAKQAWEATPGDEDLRQAYLKARAVVGVANEAYVDAKHAEGYQAFPAGTQVHTSEMQDNPSLVPLPFWKQRWFAPAAAVTAVVGGIFLLNQ